MSSSPYSAAPSSYVDAKRYFLTREAYSSPLNLLFTRYSSPYRIAMTTAMGTVGGGLFGVSWAIYHGHSKARFLARCGLGSFAFSLFYSGMNEVLNGAVQRKLKKEQFFVSNTGAGIMTWTMVHLFQKGIQKLDTRHSLMRSFKYVWTLVVVCMYNELSIIHYRDEYLGRKQKGLPEMNFGFSESVEKQEPKIQRPILSEEVERKAVVQKPVAAQTK